MMGRKIGTALVGMAALFVGGLIFAGVAGATTADSVDVCFGTPAETVIWMLGEDGRVWYTTNDNDGNGDFDVLGDVNTQNPFAAATPNVAPDDGWPASATFAAGVPVAEIWAQVPGGVFNDPPDCVVLHGTDANAFVVTVPGGDNKVWYTVFEGNTAGFNDADALGSDPQHSGGCWTAVTDVGPVADNDGWGGAGYTAGCTVVIPWVQVPIS